MSNRQDAEDEGVFSGISDEEVEDVFGLPREEWEADLSQVSGDIETVASQKPFFDAILPDLYTSHLNGDNIAEQFYNLAKERPSFGRFATFIGQHATDEVAGARIIATMACNTGEIDDATQRAFIDLWEEHAWITDMLPVIIQREDGYHFWTGQAVDIQYNDDEPDIYINWRASHGVDELWDVEMPMFSMLSMLAAVTQFQEERLENFLDDRGGSLGLESEDIEQIDDELRRLIENAESLRETVPRLQEYTIDSMNDYSDFDETLDSEEDSDDHDDDLPEYTY